LLIDLCNSPRLDYLMDSFLFGFVVGANLAWVFTSLRRDSYWREFNARRRGSNPPPPGRKPAQSAKTSCDHFHLTTTRAMSNPYPTPHTMISPTRYTPSSTHLYGLYDPDGDGITFYKSAAERDEAAEETIRSYLSDGEWCDDVTNVFAFVVTHRATEVDVVRPVGEIDEDGCDEAGEDWSNTNCDYKCNYALKPFPTPEAPNDVINPPVLATHSTPQPPADGEVAELVEWVGKDRQWLDLRRDVKDRILRIADLLQRQRPRLGRLSSRWWLGACAASALRRGGGDVTALLRQNLYI
jgi:hypothetical protein